MKIRVSFPFVLIISAILSATCVFLWMADPFPHTPNKRAETVANLQMFAQALEEYRSIYKHYPEVQYVELKYNPNSDINQWDKYLFNPDSFFGDLRRILRFLGVKINEDYEITHCGIMTKYKDDSLSIEDGWGNNILYSSAPPHDTYKLCSCGPDGKTGIDPHSGKDHSLDDIICGQD